MKKLSSCYPAIGGVYTVCIKKTKEREDHQLLPLFSALGRRSEDYIGGREEGSKESKKALDLVFSVKLQIKYNLCSCQFRKLKVQKLCFLPPNIVFIEVHFGSENIWALKKWVQKLFWVKQNFSPEKNLGPSDRFGEGLFF